MKIILTALALTALPLAAIAQSTRGHDEAISCIEGTLLNPETGLCEPITTG